jgi:hypothetical protein
MARWPSLAAAAALLAVPGVLAASPPPVVAPAALAEGALACRGLPDDFAAAGRRIDELGWPRSPNQADGQVFDRNGLVLALTPPDDHGHPMSCMVMGSIGRRVSADNVFAALASALGRQPDDSDTPERVWHLDGGQLMIAMVLHSNVLVTAWYPPTSAR